MSNQSIDFVVLIPCYNNYDGLLDSLKSIVYMKGKYETFIVDDGSNVPISEEKLRERFPEMIIHVLRIHPNKGILNALNTALEQLRLRDDVKYIARLDAGDTCSETRFYKQVEFLNTHTDISLLASWARFQSTENNKGCDYITKTTHEGILREMHYKCSFIHPSVIFKKEIIDTVGAYPVTFEHAEDYAYFWKILKFYKGAVLPEKLIQITFLDSNVSSKNYKAQLRSRKKVVREFATNFIDKWLGIMILNLKLILPKRLLQRLKSS